MKKVRCSFMLEKETKEWLDKQRENTNLLRGEIIDNLIKQEISFSYKGVEE